MKTTTINILSRLPGRETMLLALQFINMNLNQRIKGLYGAH